jgi:hypothetical protein
VSIGQIYYGATDGVIFSTSPASVLIGATAKATLWMGGIKAPRFAITKAHASLTIDTEAGTVEVPITEADWAGFPRGVPAILTVEVELRRDADVAVLPHQELTVKPRPST